MKRHVHLLYAVLAGNFELWASEESGNKSKAWLGIAKVAGEPLNTGADRMKAEVRFKSMLERQDSFGAPPGPRLPSS